jgi:hypothetical protein
MYTNEEKELLKAARLLNTYCKKQKDCDDCIFSINDGFDCAINAEAENWDILTEEEEEY